MRVTTVSVMLGKVMVWLVVVMEANVRVVAVVAPEERKPIFLVASVLSAKKDEPLVRVLLVRVSVVALPKRVSVEEGTVSVPPLVMAEMIGKERVLLERVWVADAPTRVSVASGKVRVLLAVMTEARVKVRAVVAPEL